MKKFKLVQDSIEANFVAEVETLAKNGRSPVNGITMGGHPGCWHHMLGFTKKEAA